MPIVNFQVRYGSQGAQVYLLTGQLTRIIGTRMNKGGEVFDSLDLVFWENTFSQGGKVKPFIRSPLDGAIIKIEGINIEIGFHEAIQDKKKQGPPLAERPCALSPKLLGWVISKESYNFLIRSVKRRLFLLEAAIRDFKFWSSRVKLFWVPSCFLSIWFTT